MKIDLNLNGQQVSWRIQPGESLLAALRRHGCLSVKRGCESGECGACTILLDGQPVNSCVVAAGRVRGHRLATMEGLRFDPLMQKLQEHFVAAGAVQCGFCTPGMLISLFALLKAGGPLEEGAVRAALSGNLCRCTGYVGPVQAALAAAKERP